MFVLLRTLDSPFTNDPPVPNMAPICDIVIRYTCGYKANFPESPYTQPFHRFSQLLSFWGGWLRLQHLDYGPIWE